MSIQKSEQQVPVSIGTEKARQNTLNLQKQQRLNPLVIQFSAHHSFLTHLFSSRFAVSLSIYSGRVCGWVATPENQRKLPNHRHWTNFTIFQMR